MEECCTQSTDTVCVLGAVAYLGDESTPRDWRFKPQQQVITRKSRLYKYLGYLGAFKHNFCNVMVHYNTGEINI